MGWAMVVLVGGFGDQVPWASLFLYFLKFYGLYAIDAVI